MTRLGLPAAVPRIAIEQVAGGSLGGDRPKRVIPSGQGRHRQVRPASQLVDDAVALQLVSNWLVPGEGEDDSRAMVAHAIEEISDRPARIRPGAQMHPGDDRFAGPTRERAEHIGERDSGVDSLSHG
jgi:hypothetical protein